MVIVAEPRDARSDVGQSTAPYTVSSGTSTQPSGAGEEAVWTTQARIGEPGPIICGDGAGPSSAILRRENGSPVDGHDCMEEDGGYAKCERDARTSDGYHNEGQPVRTFPWDFCQSGTSTHPPMQIGINAANSCACWAGSARRRA